MCTCYHPSQQCGLAGRRPPTARFHGIGELLAREPEPLASGRAVVVPVCRFVAVVGTVGVNNGPYEGLGSGDGAADQREVRQRENESKGRREAIASLERGKHWTLTGWKAVEWRGRVCASMGHLRRGVGEVERSGAVAHDGTDGGRAP
jgi:hypothetical protein